MNKFNVWSFSSFVISFVVIIPILTVSVSFFEETSNYYQILKDTFLLEYIFNSAVLLIGVLILQIVTTVLIGWGLSWEAQQFILGLLIIPMVALYARSPHIRSQI